MYAGQWQRQNRTAPRRKTPLYSQAKCATPSPELKGYLSVSHLLIHRNHYYYVTLLRHIFHPLEKRHDGHCILIAPTLVETYSWDPKYVHGEKMSENESEIILHALREIVQGLRIFSLQIEHETGISGAQLFVLQKIHEANRPLSLSEVARLTLTHISSVSVVVRKLHEQKFIKKLSAEQDQRKSVISLDKKGLQLLKLQPKTAQHALIAAIQSLDTADQKMLAKLLSVVSKRAKLTLPLAPMFFEESSIRVKNTKAKRTANKA